MNDSRLRRNRPEKRRPIFIVTAEFDRASNLCHYAFIGPNGETHDYTAKFSLEELRTTTGRLRESLRQYLFSDFSRKALKKLAQAGAEAFRAATTDVDGNRDRARDARRKIADLIRRTPEAIISFSSKTGILPLDLFYLADPGKEVDAKHFVGMRHAITRTLRAPVTGKNALDMELLRCEGEVQIGIACDETLVGARAEKESFTKMRGKFKAREIPHLESGPFLADWKRARHRVIHCSCHGEWKLVPQEHWLHFRDTQMSVEAAEFENGVAEKRQPFVFLNACETGMHLLSDHLSFAKRILGVCGSALMVTETKIRDSVANAFAHAFYSYFLKGMTASEALLLTRQTIMSAGHGLSGLAYSLHAAPLYRIEYEETKS